EVVVGDDKVLVEHQLLAQAVAGGAGALRRIERKQPRLDLGDGEARDGAGEFLREDDPAGNSEVQLHPAPPLPLMGRGRGWGAGGDITPTLTLPDRGGGN